MEFFIDSLSKAATPSAISQFYTSMSRISTFIRVIFNDLLYTFYGGGDEFTMMNVIMWWALFPALIGFVVDLVFSFILSFRHKRIIAFNPFSARSWSLLRSNTPAVMNSSPYRVSSSSLRENRKYSNNIRYMSFVPLRSSPYEAKNSIKYGKTYNSGVSETKNHSIPAGTKNNAKNERLYTSQNSSIRDRDRNSTIQPTLRYTRLNSSFISKLRDFSIWNVPLFRKLSHAYHNWRARQRDSGK